MCCYLFTDVWYSSMDYDDLECTLYVIIHHQLYPITKSILYEVFSLYGYVEEIVRYKWSVDFRACVKFYSRKDARRAFHEPLGKHIYDDGCKLELWLVHSGNLPNCRAYEANLITTTLKSKKTHGVASYYLGGRYPGIASSLPQLQSNEK